MWINGQMKVYIHTVLKSAFNMYGRLQDVAALPRGESRMSGFQNWSEHSGEDRNL
jgi:hypothetical protein